MRKGRPLQLRRLPAPGDQLLHRAGHAVRDAVQHLRPGPLLQQEGVHRRRPGSELAAEDARRRARRGREAEGQRGVGPARAQDRAGVLRALARAGQPALREQQQRTQGARTKTVYNDPIGRRIFTWLSGMVKDGLATTNPDLGTGNFDNLLGIQSGSHAMAFETSAALGTISAVLGGGRCTQRRARGRAVPVADDGGEGRGAREWRRAVHGEQVGAGEAGGGVEVPEVPRPARQPHHLGDRHRLPADPQGVGRQRAHAAVLGAAPRVQGRLRPAPQRADDGRNLGFGDRQLHRRPRRVARRREHDVPPGQRPEGGADGRGKERQSRRSTTTTPASAGSRSLARQPRSSTGTYGRLVAPV